MPSPPKRRRLFVAIPLGASAKDACAEAVARLRATGLGGRWVSYENFHVTVAFLGSVVEGKVGAVVAALTTAARKSGPFALTLDRIGAFPNARRARTVWFGPAGAVPAFGALCANVRQALAECGFDLPPNDDAHVTLLRANETQLPQIAVPRMRPVTVDTVVLYQSFTESNGPRYVELARLALGH